MGLLHKTSTTNSLCNCILKNFLSYVHPNSELHLYVGRSNFDFMCTNIKGVSRYKETFRYIVSIPAL